MFHGNIIIQWNTIWLKEKVIRQCYVHCATVYLLTLVFWTERDSDCHLHHHCRYLTHRANFEEGFVLRCENASLAAALPVPMSAQAALHDYKCCGAHNTLSQFLPPLQVRTAADTALAGTWILISTCLLSSVHCCMLLHVTRCKALRVIPAVGRELAPLKMATACILNLLK